MNLRNAIIQNLHGQNENQLSATIQDAVAQGEEKTLPGLGVMFELFWKNSQNDEKQAVLQKMASALQS
ncbi:MULTISPECIES: small acid-soluble spore protein SspI [Bacillaceae]|jgi:small acid-soluble spore protein I (minor)|uniref:Small, acid-soluble spore protein I n=1 Tax=Domibacillus aminovorans TaxID=29332 RepID=A0A177KS72_9BACI|nr:MULTISPECIES: small acid-soluble spore protein SspI [Bacillaceae]OAH56192.1 small, acid-soluble spore protein I [Domibacillus aminovorans]OAH62660.1 small, acid-soluble spore protein I [Domibacillus aminovorans]